MFKLMGNIHLLYNLHHLPLHQPGRKFHHQPTISTFSIFQFGLFLFRSKWQLQIASPAADDWRVVVAVHASIKHLSMK